jgi:hypothetical protein
MNLNRTRPQKKSGAANFVPLFRRSRTRVPPDPAMEHTVNTTEDLPWTTEFSLSDQLRAKQRVFAASDHDWPVHADADEWLCSPIEGQSLLQGLNAADERGYTCVNARPAQAFAPPCMRQRARPLTAAAG